MDMMSAPSSSTNETMAVSMSMDMPNNSCKLSMLLNWSTIDTCYLTSTLHVHSTFQFILVCFLSFILPIALEGLRRCQRKYDRYLRVKNRMRQREEEIVDGMEEKLLGGPILKRVGWTRVVVIEQTLRGILHMTQFVVSYCIMMMWMYSNGYIIISISLGALLGFGLLTRDLLHLSETENGLDERDKGCC